MTSEQARAALTSHFEAQWPALLPDYDRFIDGVNAPDFNTQSKPFSFFCVEILSVKQSALLGDTPPTRSTGLLEIGLFVKDGGGTKPFMLMTDAIQEMFASKVVSGISCMSLNSSKRVAAIGWQSRVLRVDFRFDSI